MPELQKTVIQPDNVYKPVGYPFSQAIRVPAGEFLFVAGQPAMDVEANTIGIGDMVAQTRQVYESLGNILESVGATFSNVVELTTFIVGRENLPAHLEVISELYPTYSLMGITRQIRLRSSTVCIEKISCWKLKPSQF